jgi:putative nucleotidyltransferase with HDIG domain
MSKTKEEILLDFLHDEIIGTEFSNKVFVAGGWVRDFVMGKKSKDIDLTVALPRGGIHFAEWITKKNNCYKESINPVIFPNFGTAKFNLRGVVYHGVDLSEIDVETVMTRKEQYHDGSRKPEVDFGTPEQDVERRDLTINSLLYDVTNRKILDLTGKGLEDIKNHVIRTPMDANVIFKEDPLRMCRAIRFTTKYGWDLSDDVFKSIKQNADKLQSISKERVRDELDKIITSNYPDVGIRLLMDTDLMKYIMPEYYQLIGLEQNYYHQWDAFEHSMRVLKHTPASLEVRLAALFHDLGKTKTRSVGKDQVIHFNGHESVSASMARGILTGLKYPTNIIDNVCKLVANHMRTKQFGDDLGNASDKSLRKLMQALGDQFENFLHLVDADNNSHGEKGWKHNLENQVKIIKNRIKTIGDFTGKLEMPIDGDRIMKLLNLKSGPQVGKIKSAFEDAFLENPEDFKNMTDQQIDDFIKDLFKAFNVKESKISDKIITEWVDGFKAKNGRLKSYTDSDAYPFGLDNRIKDDDRIIVGKAGSTHYNSHIKSSGPYGRFWTSCKVISFWNYPKTKQELMNIIEKINLYLNKNLIDDNWKVDIPLTDKLAQGAYTAYNMEGDVKSLFVPVHSYNYQIIKNPVVFKQELEKRNMIHLMSPTEKEKINRSKNGMGSEKDGGGFTNFQYKYTSENKLREYIRKQINEILKQKGKK